MQNDKGFMNQTLTIKRWVLIGSVHIVPSIHDLFLHHQLEWRARSVGLYNEELEREFYVFYVLTLRDSLDRLSNFAKQTTLTYVQVHGRRVDIPLPPHSLFLIPC